MGIVPKNKPGQARDWVEKQVKDYDLKKYKIYLVGFRGYYLDTMGVKGKNDRALYDDAIFSVSDVGFTSWNANTDPSIYRKGSGTGERKGVASLKTGLWLYKKGIHRGYKAFVQAAPVTVQRDGSPDYEDTGYFGINIHKGGINGTSSLGCQTIYPTQWEAFRAYNYELMDRFGQKIIPYVLLEKQG